MEYFNIRSAVRGDPPPWSERTFLLIRAREICSFRGLSDLQRIMMHLPWDNRRQHFSSSNRAALPNYHLFFILFSETVLFHVPLIQMVGMIIGAPNLMQPIFACYFAHVCAGVQHSPWQQKRKTCQAEWHCCPGITRTGFISTTAPHKQVFIHSLTT